MPKLGMEPTRRAAIINAALTCINLYGMDGTTLDKVAESAGCSKGVVAYYFKNKDNLIVEAFRSFLAYFGQKIEAELEPGITAEAMLDVVLHHILPPYQEDAEADINVSPLDGAEKMAIPYVAMGRLFVQFFSRAVLDSRLQEVAAQSYREDQKGIAKIFEYGSRTGHFAVQEPANAAYGLLAMAVGLSFFRVSGVEPPGGGDNRSIFEEYVDRFRTDREEGEK
ncbi:hypothetical protein J31TS4_14590 [Paenibacillus sp. J31TS4]|uniref:TetR/AcrR family transcriptional regulator n=1 Tax=Paenibacillus sp. J31TS4 TaxID=2807195 RepID=UPI001B07ABD6|nr:TetR/AcrR family transcriptional regulator [Paenibacillus sp. J31TS4]GIP38179.1 hypothetical protein J31TS4_14590 [Paenibacillus sp. J31TS4]